MDKRKLSWLFKWIVALVFLALGIGIASSVQKKITREEAQAQLSLQNIESINGELFIDPTEVIKVLFHPTCDFCQQDATEILKSIHLFEGIQLLWVSYDHKDSIVQFSQTFGLDTLQNIHFAYMDIEVMLERYGNVRFPTFLAYDKKGQLLKKFVGATLPEEIASVYEE